MDEDIHDHYDVRKDELYRIELKEVWNFDRESAIESSLHELVGLLNNWIRDLVGGRV